ncbi:hypothetical protein I307_00052 [Cryptococcus deuterogattii 99/473]|uniref:Uncharacterized protein n=1 Tax=Cryptococcus deuterogattii Ram5 TaxID=1296110 RepID=A0A0D0VGC0_9TREE|nr:hypothetical protein I309_00843 [Cryptococcus deuterogattii LA55]KIR43905.1 hypothetical protein I313_00751 [Cryptococcus deuterogattii Ram5]KIR92906.1 hypothetical protein I304_03487 [Cryptococcus deuterogattii CBS 10090]KIR98228.1 hypothetical protein L804_04690 [Cryptococcus deuterogattii 2001/935-1]KIY60253.1 hypothetical protein I307_00052 [Cryptococcus deuterogattii 99/473]
MSYPPSTTYRNPTQPSIDAPVIAKQPISQRVMDIRNAGSKEPTQERQQDEEVMRLRGGCPGRFCGLPPCIYYTRLYVSIFAQYNITFYGQRIIAFPKRIYPSGRTD